MDEFFRVYGDTDDLAKVLQCNHHQCDQCGKITKGPGMEKRSQPPKYPYKLNHIDENGVGTTYQERPDLPYNVSTGRCPDCAENLQRQAARDMNWRQKMRDWAKQRGLDFSVLQGQQTYQETIDKGAASYQETIDKGAASYQETIDESVPVPEPPAPPQAVTPETE